MRFTYPKVVSILSLACLPFFAQAQDCGVRTNIGTFAGNHTDGNSGDGGAATAAQMGRPYCVALGQHGDVYIADYDHNVVRKVNSSGTISTFAGTGAAGYNGDNIPATSAQLNGPAGVTVDGTGNVYIADKFNERIRKIDLAGNITTIAGNGLHSYFPATPDGNEGPATSAALTYPVSVAFDCSGNTYIADWGGQTIRRIDAIGIIHRFAGNGAGAYSGDGGPAASASINAPACVIADCSGNVYIADSWNNRIRKVDASGIITTIAGNGVAGFSGDDGPATSASLWIPSGLSFAPCGDIYIADYNNNVVRLLDHSGTISTFAGNNTRGYDGDGGLTANAALYLPSSIAIDQSNLTFYIADFGNNVVRYAGNLPYAHRAFANGTTQDIEMMENALPVSLNSMMTIHDDAPGKTETWTISRMPQHGTLAGFGGSIVSAGGDVTPSGLSYTPEAGYTGNDDFTVQMSDGTTTASTTVNVKVNPATTSVVTAGSNVPGRPVLYPNPSTGSFTYSFTSETTCDLLLTVADVTGRVVLTQDFHAAVGENKMNVQLPAGIPQSSIMIVSLGNSSIKYPAVKIMVGE